MNCACDRISNSVHVDGGAVVSKRPRHVLLSPYSNIPMECRAQGFSEVRV